MSGKGEKNLEREGSHEHVEATKENQTRQQRCRNGHSCFNCRSKGTHRESKTESTNYLLEEDEDEHPVVGSRGVEVHEPIHDESKAKGREESEGELTCELGEEISQESVCIPSHLSVDNDLLTDQDVDGTSHGRVSLVDGNEEKESSAVVD
jgi:hypothetical protein